jgi:hypothetical protein
MTEKLFVTGVATLTAYDPSTEQVVLRGRSLLDSSLKTSLSKVEIRGGKGHSLLGQYFHTSAMELSLSNPVFDMQFLAESVGSTLNTGGNVYYQENITLGAGGTGTVTYTPLATDAGTAGTAYGWVTKVDDSVERVTFSTKSFTSTGAENDVVCVKYFMLNAAAKQFTVSSHIIPSILRVELDADLASNEESSNVVGSLQIVVPLVSFNGAMELNLKSDGTVTTPMVGNALESPPPAGSGCLSQGIYAYISQIKTTANFYDDLVAIAIVGGDKAMTHPSTATLVVKGIHTDNTVSTIANSALTFSSGTVGTATIGANTGVITTVASGSTLLKATVTAATQFDSEITLTVT